MLVAILRMLMLVLMVVVVLVLLLLLLLLLLQGLGSCHGATVLPLNVQLGHDTVRRTAKQSVNGDLQQQQVQCNGNHDSKTCVLPIALDSWLLPAADAVDPCQCITDCAINSSQNTTNRMIVPKQHHCCFGQPVERLDDTAATPPHS